LNFSPEKGAEILQRIPEMIRLSQDIEMIDYSRSLETMSRLSGLRHRKAIKTQRL
jgi:hypothetical protein